MENFNINRDIAHLAILQRIELASSKLKKIFKEVVIIKVIPAYINTCSNEEVNKKYIGLELDYRFNAEDDPNRYYYRSDHYNFAKNNIPVIFYFNGVHEDYHKETDTIEKILFEKIERITQLIFLTAWELANREERISLNEK